MVDGLTVAGHIFVDDGKGGTVGYLLHAQRFAQHFDEGGLARPHLAVEGKHSVVGPRFEQLCSHLRQFRFGITGDGHEGKLRS